MLTRHQNSVCARPLTGHHALPPGRDAGRRRTPDAMAYERRSEPLVQTPLTTRYPAAPNAPEAAMR